MVRERIEGGPLSLYLACMNVQSMLKAIADEMAIIFPRLYTTVRYMRGYWEIVTTYKSLTVECTIGDGGKVYITCDAEYSKTIVTDLSDPGWIDDFFKIIGARLVAIGIFGGVV